MATATTTTITLDYTDPSGGLPPYTNTLQINSGSGWSDLIAVTPGDQILVEELTPDTTYTFRVKTEDSYNPQSQTVFSNEIEQATDPAPEEHDDRIYKVEVSGVMAASEPSDTDAGFGYLKVIQNVNRVWYVYKRSSLSDDAKVFYHVPTSPHTEGFAFPIVQEVAELPGGEIEEWDEGDPDTLLHEGATVEVQLDDNSLRIDCQTFRESSVSGRPGISTVMFTDDGASFTLFSMNVNDSIVVLGSDNAFFADPLGNRAGKGGTATVTRVQ